MKTARSKLTTVHRYTTPICLPTRLQPSYRARRVERRSSCTSPPMHHIHRLWLLSATRVCSQTFPYPSLFQRGRRVRQTHLDWQHTHPDTRGGEQPGPTLSPAIALATVCGGDGW